MAEFINFNCDVDEEDYVQVDTTELERHRENSIYIETITSDGSSVIRLNRENARKFAEYILYKLKETE